MDGWVDEIKGSLRTVYNNQKKSPNFAGSEWRNESSAKLQTKTKQTKFLKGDDSCLMLGGG